VVSNIVYARACLCSQLDPLCFYTVYFLTRCFYTTKQDSYVFNKAHYKPRLVMVRFTLCDESFQPCVKAQSVLVSIGLPGTYPTHYHPYSLCCVLSTISHDHFYRYIV
jgi:hypothetical protein